jgi:hypothetical protein
MTNEILDEIRRVRDEIARECDYDIHKLSQRIREGTEKLKAEGWKVVSPAPQVRRKLADAPYVLREEPTKEQKR